MVQAGYLLARKRAPSELRRFVNQQVIPTAIDGAAAMEAALEQLSVRTRRRPMTALGAAAGVGLVAGLLTGRRHLARRA